MWALPGPWARRRLRASARTSAQARDSAALSAKASIFRVGWASLIPGPAEALDEGESPRRPPGSRRIGLGFHARRGPGVGHAVDPFPGLLDLVAAHEQGGHAVDDLQHQGLVGDAPARVLVGVALGQAQ